METKPIGAAEDSLAKLEALFDRLLQATSSRAEALAQEPPRQRRSARDLVDLVGCLSTLADLRRELLAQQASELAPLSEAEIKAEILKLACEAGLDGAPTPLDQTPR